LATGGQCLKDLLAFAGQNPTSDSEHVRCEFLKFAREEMQDKKKTYEPQYLKRLDAYAPVGF
jgi:hypothetical protein